MLEDVFKLTEKSMIVFSKHEAVIKSCIYGELYICFTTFSLGVGIKKETNNRIQKFRNKIV
jgi:hypothetical protein